MCRIGRNGSACSPGFDTLRAPAPQLTLLHFEGVRNVRMLPAIGALELRGGGLQKREIDARQQAISLKKQVTRRVVGLGSAQFPTGIGERGNDEFLENRLCDGASDLAFCGP